MVVHAKPELPPTPTADERQTMTEYRGPRQNGGSGRGQRSGKSGEQSRRQGPQRAQRTGYGDAARRAQPRRSEQPARADQPTRSGQPRGGRGRGSNARTNRGEAGVGRAEPGAPHGGQAGPSIPDEITGNELDPATLKELSSLGARAIPVARHLVAAWQLLDSDPDLAAEHALAASARGARSAPVREAAGEALYAAGRYDKALAELRAAKRLSGSVQMLPVMADCERGLGRPERALALADSDDARRLRAAAAVEMRIVAAGARADLGQPESGLATLEVPLLYSAERSEPAARLRYAYADLLERSGDRAQAREWFTRAADADVDDSTDAAERRDALAQP
jgi:tetratricopeptide (TPR) repeat protein